MTSLSDWVGGARPRTLPAAIAPVLVGSAVAYWEGAFQPGLAALALAVALALQVGVNYANDYSDGVRGTDEVRVGPVRLVGQGLASPKSVKLAAFGSFAVAGVAGLWLTLVTGYWIFLPIGLLAVLSAWGYTGGKNPYGYLGLGEVFVFVWFGLAAVLGTAYAQTGHVTAFGIAMAVASGAFACALLVINNLRDIPSDTVAGKRTLAVRLGDLGTRKLYVALVWTATVISIVISLLSVNDQAAWPYYAAAGALGGAYAIRPTTRVRAGASGRDLVIALAETGRAQVLWAVLTTLGVLLQKYLVG